jgi:hypothetical protein
MVIKTNPIKNHLENHMTYFDALSLTDEQKAAAVAAPTYTESYDEMPTRLEMAVALFTRTASSDAQGSVHARSVRIPTIENLTIDALAKYSGLSANKVICQLLEVALDEVFQGFTDEQRQAVFDIRRELLKGLPQKNGFPDLGGDAAGKGEI